MNCPECGALMREREDRFPDCEECGFEQYDAYTLALIAETRREFDQAKRECWPDPVPTYKEWMERQ